MTKKNTFKFKGNHDLVEANIEVWWDLHTLKAALVCKFEVKAEVSGVKVDYNFTHKERLSQHQIQELLKLGIINEEKIIKEI